MSPHSFTFTICGFTYCSKCGLVWLKNEATQRAIKKGCQGREE